MTGDVLPEDHHISRHCGKDSIDQGIVNGGAFRRRPNEIYLSVNWLEHFEGLSREQAMVEICSALRAKGRNVGRQSWFLILAIGALKEGVARELGLRLEVRHEPEDLDPSHSGIHGCPPDDDVLGDLIAETIGDDDRIPASELLDRLS